MGHVHGWALDPQIPVLILPLGEGGLPARPGTWTSVNSFQPSLPKARSTRGLCPRLPGSPSEGRGLQIPAEADPPLRNPAPKCWKLLCELPFRPLYLLPKTQDAEPQAVTRTHESHTHEPKTGMPYGIRREKPPKSLNTL